MILITSARSLMVISMSIFLVSTISCKPADSGSDLKTLDNFAAGSRVSLNECVGDPKTRNGKGLKVILSALDKKILWNTKKNKSAMTKAIHDGFSAIPPDFQNAFMELGGQVIVSSESNILCTAQERYASIVDDKKFPLKELKVLKEGLDEVVACYQFMPPSAYKKRTGNAGQVISIVLPDDVTEIKHSFVRSFGFLVAQMYSRISLEEGTDDIYWTSAENPEFRKLKGQVAAGFLQDVSKTSNAKNFRRYLEGGKASLKDKRSFADFVYAEAFDSYYCNAFASGPKNTRNVMDKNFHNTYNAFLGVKKQGFGLTDTDASGSFDANLNLASSNTSGVLNTMNHAITVGKTRSFRDSKVLITEKMHKINWYKFADVPGIPRKGNGQSGFNLGWVPQWVKNVGTATRETVQGAGILYGNYYDRTSKATARALDSRSSGGRNPGVLGTVSAVGRGVSDGTGYTDQYNRIQRRTDNIYTQVQEGRGQTDKPLGFLDTASVVANATVDSAKDIPGPVGDIATVARGTTSAGTGGTFDSEGNFQELSTGQRFAAGGEALVTFADLSGATGKVTDAVMGSGGNVKRFGRANSSELSGFGETAFEQGGRGLQRLNIANDQFGRALSNSGTFQAVNTAADFAGVKPPTSITGAIKKTGNAASTGLGNAIDSDGNSGGGGAAGSF